MKILDIRLTNLNSLRGQWRIDLTDKVYTSGGIFAITGPTGAGKTTIFDAVCLALYGRTSRLKKVSGADNQIMSIGCSECYAQVTFSTDAGTFTARWGQSRKKNGGFQTPTHHLTDEVTHIPITTDKVKTQREIERITGMDFDRFTQAMMLAQGEFDKFLTADKNHKGEILELITGTKIYGEISSRVYKRAKDENTKLDNLKAQLETHKANDELIREEEINASYIRKKREAAELQAVQENIRRDINLLREIKTLRDDLSKNQQDINTQQAKAADFEAKRKTLDAAERAEAIMAEYLRLLPVRVNRRKAHDECVRLQEELAGFEAEISRIVTETLPALIRKKEDISHGITEAPEAVKGKIIAVIERYEAAVNDKKKMNADLRMSESGYMLVRDNLQKRTAARTAAHEAVNQAGQLHREIMNDLMSLRARTTEAVLSEERSKLRPGMPCPLCGSTEHPNAGHSHAGNDKADELFRQTERLEEELKRCSAIVDDVMRKSEAADEAYNRALAEESRIENKCSQLRDSIKAKTQEADRLHDESCQAIAPFNFTGIKDTTDLKSRLQTWVDDMTKIEAAIQEQEHERGNLTSRAEGHREMLKGKRTELEVLSGELETLETEFKNRLAEKNFADEETFRVSHMNPAELSALRNEGTAIAANMSALVTMRGDITKKLDAKTELYSGKMTLEEAENISSSNVETLAGLYSDIGILQQKLKDIEILKGKISETEKKYLLQQDISDRWAKLDKLIGSASGDKFRIFAQKITLELVVNNANDYLRKMNGRYTLVITPHTEELELSVIDYEHSKKIRPTENLSGGERFIVSLALALGLSQLSGSRARVDSLFLDEGFGSLDEDSLSTALEALSEIRRDGRMIGIISHVQALKDRISAQINVIPKREGVSVLEGAGCSRE